MLSRRSAATRPAAQPAYLLRGATLPARCCCSCCADQNATPILVCRSAGQRRRKDGELAYSTLTSLVVPALTRHDSPWICSQTMRQASHTEFAGGWPLPASRHRHASGQNSVMQSRGRQGMLTMVLYWPGTVRLGAKYLRHHTPGQQESKKLDRLCTAQHSRQQPLLPKHAAQEQTL